MKVNKIRRRTIIACLFTLTALLCTLGSRAGAQTTTGSIYGTVTDQTGAVIPNTTVTVRNIQTNETHIATTGGSGNYIFPALEPGNYTVSAQVSGFRTVTQSGVRLDVSQNVHVSFSLLPGSVGQAITVTAATTLVDTHESQLGETVDRRRIEDLPLNGRNAYDLVQTVPGITHYQAESITGDQNGAQFSVSGNRVNANSIYLDGAFDTAVYRNGGNLIPNPDALEEFHLLTSNFDAEFGRSPGGVVNLITRSGTNTYHGLLYDYLRNNVLNAKNYFDNGVTPLKRNQFGGTFGGPIARNKAFFFVSYEGLRIRTPEVVASSSLTTPTPAEAHGDFSAENPKLWPKQPNGQPYSCNGVQGVICPGLLDPVAQNMLKTVPLADPMTGRTPEQSAQANSTANQVMVRIDYQLTSHHKLSGTFFTSIGRNNDPSAGKNQMFAYSGVSNYDNTTNVVLSDTWGISANALNSLRLFYTHNHFVKANIYSGNTLSDLGSQAGQGAYPLTQPQYQINGYWSAGMGGSGPGAQEQQPFGMMDTFNWIRGNHTVKAGGSFIWIKYDETGQFLGSGLMAFTGSSTGNALGDFLLGKANSFQQNSGVYHRLHVYDPAMFIQDDWRITHKLTLDLGARWEVYPPYTGQGVFGTFVPNVQSRRFPTAPLGLLSSGDPGVPDGVLHTSWTKFAPRVGFAYDVFGKGTTALRGSYGIFYAASQETLSGNLEQQPFVLSVIINKTPNLVTPYAPNADPFPYVVDAKNPRFTSGATLAGLPPNNNSIPYVQEFNFTVQQQLGTEWSAQLAYVGGLSRKFYLLRDQNSAVYAPGASNSSAGLNARRPYEPTPATYTFGQISEVSPSANSSYNALQATLTRRFAHNFSFNASYVWSKSIDIDSFDPANATNLPLVNQNDPGMDRGLSGLDIPQRFVASYLWQSPNIRRWGVFGRQVLSGWQLNGITTLSKGSPFTVTSGVDTNRDGNNNDRPNVVGNPIFSGGRSRSQKIHEFFNKAAFAQLPAAVPYGNASRGMMIGPGYVNTDFSAFKSFPVWKESTLQFRGEIFNTFNNVNLNNPNGTMTSPKFGTIGGAGAPRIVQFALRYAF
ncbi:MAG: TonB-dependent receptor [Acidobacteriaceae bacterium]